MCVNYVIKMLVHDVKLHNISVVNSKLVNIMIHTHTHT